MEESKWSNKCGTFRVSGNFLRGQPKKIWNEVTRSYLKDGKVSKDKAEDKKFLKVYHKKSSNPYKHGKQRLKQI